AQTAEEQAAIILEHRIPYTTAIGALAHVTPALLVALITAMSPQEVVNNLGALKRRGALDDKDVKALIDQKLQAAVGDRRVSTMKAKRAMQAVDLDAETARTLTRVTDERVAAKVEPHLRIPATEPVRGLGPLPPVGRAHGRAGRRGVAVGACRLPGAVPPPARGPAVAGPGRRGGWHVVGAPIQRERRPAAARPRPVRAAAGPPVRPYRRRRTLRPRAGARGWAHATVRRARRAGRPGARGMAARGAGGSGSA